MVDAREQKTPVRGPLTLYLGDVVRLRKPHPCGAFDWTIVRLGADIGLRCHGCNHRVLLTRRTLEKRLKTFLSRGPEGSEDTAPNTPATSDSIIVAAPI